MEDPYANVFCRDGAAGNSTRLPQFCSRFLLSTLPDFHDQDLGEKQASTSRQSPASLLRWRYSNHNFESRLLLVALNGTIAAFFMRSIRGIR